MRKGIILILVLLSALIISCNLPKAKKAKFNIPQEELKAKFEEFGELKDVKWRATVFDGDTSNSIVVSLYVKDDFFKTNKDEKIKVIGKNVMQVLFDIIDNENDYNIYYVEFVNQKGAESVNVSRSSSYDYTREEIEGN